MEDYLNRFRRLVHLGVGVFFILAFSWIVPGSNMSKKISGKRSFSAPKNKIRRSERFKMIRIHNFSIWIFFVEFILSEIDNSRTVWNCSEKISLLVVDGLNSMFLFYMNSVIILYFLYRKLESWRCGRPSRRRRMQRVWRPSSERR